MKENYTITLTDAKNMKEYSFETREDVNTREKLINFIKNGKSDINNDQMAFDMYLGNLSIETELFYDESNNTFTIAYFVCANYKEEGWRSEDYSGEGISGSIDDIEKIITEQVYYNIEGMMFNQMIQYARNHKLFWSKENKW